MLLTRYYAIVLFVLVTLLPATVLAVSACEPDGVQTSGSIYRICMPAPASYNGDLVIWAHGFQDAGTPVQIPEDQLMIGGVSIIDIINQLGFAFATNSYSKTGLAVRQGMADILDLVDIFISQQGVPERIYIVGASEGGIITTLLTEQYPQVFTGGMAVCGPIGSFPYQINYFGDARATFEIFFPGVIPGDTFNPSQELVENWAEYYEQVVKPEVFAPANRQLLDQWAKVARLPFEQSDYLNTLEISVKDVLRYSVVNLKDAAATLGGFPYENRKRIYKGSNNDLILNLKVQRVAADGAALQEMSAHYQTSGLLDIPLVTMHTLKDQQVPYLHQFIYSLKTLAAGNLISKHVPLTSSNFGHCNFDLDEVLTGFFVMLSYTGGAGVILN